MLSSYVEAGCGTEMMERRRKGFDHDLVRLAC